MPSLSDVDINEIAEMWHFTFTIEVKGPTSEHRIQYFGPQLASIFGTDHTGEMMDEASQDSMLFNTIGFYPKVIESRSPGSESSSFYIEGKEVRYRSLIVPLSSDGKTIDYLLGTTNYKMFDNT